MKHMMHDSAPNKKSMLAQLHEQQSITPLSYFFARFICREAGESEDSVLAFSAAMLSERNQKGDVCINLSQHAGKEYFPADKQQRAVELVLKNVPAAPSIEVWREKLLLTDCVGLPGTHAPIILDNDTLYLSRFWNYEQLIASALLARSEQVSDIDEMKLRDGLMRLFPEEPGAIGINWQKLASALAVTQRFAVISGGPGTGKTTTVVKVLALLLEQNAKLQIRLAAPTGKAAARMVESIRSRKNEIAMDASIQALIPEQASTLHRLLSYDGKRFRFNSENRLSADCLVIDEASMIDITLMANLLSAMPAHTRLILLGDRDQLASVEAGNVLGDITGRGHEIAYGKERAKYLADICGINSDAAEEIRSDATSSEATPADAIALLRTSFRFHKDSGIGNLARLVNSGDGKAAIALLDLTNEKGTTSPAFAKEINWLNGEDDRLSSLAVDWAVNRYTNYLRCSEIDHALTALAQTRVLCALHNGDLGETEFNRRIEERLGALGLLTGGEQCHGKPVMVTVNDYELELFNGDIGLIWRNTQGESRVWFPQANGEVRDIPVNSLPTHVPAWAMTVHKSQGSEFDQVLLVLPQDENSPLLSRELIYTGITRAKEKLIVHGHSRAFVRGCINHVQRSSGLAARLGW